MKLLSQPLVSEGLEQIDSVAELRMPGTGFGDSCFMPGHILEGRSKLMYIVLICEGFEQTLSNPSYAYIRG